MRYRIIMAQCRKWTTSILLLEDYGQLETERALRNGKEYKWETTMFGKIWSQHVDEVDLKDETSVFEYDDEEYNGISFNDLFPFNIYFVNDSKLHTDNDDDDDKIDVK
ncbi:hypothetical protein Tco_1542041 [Tanacetum coccineum]